LLDYKLNRKIAKVKTNGNRQGGEKMNKKILTLTSIGLLLTFCVLVASFSLVVANGSKNNSDSLHYANIGTASLMLAGHPDISFGFFDKMRWSDLGAADILDIFVIDHNTGAPILFGIITDNEDYKEFYDEVFAGVFPPAIVVEPDEFEVWKKGTNIYVELKVPVTLYTFTGDPFELPAFSIKIDSFDQPYRETTEPSTFPSGWTWVRKTRRAYNAVTTFNCDTWASLGYKSLGTAQFNTVDVFTPPPT
jgi:hypothetical protein